MVRRPFSLYRAPSHPRPLAVGQVDAYEIELLDGSYLHAVFDQLGIDVVVDVFAPGHRKLFRVDSPNGAHGPEEIHLVAEAGGHYRFEVSPGFGASPGEYFPSLRELRGATAVDRSQAFADRVFYQARQIEREPGRFWETVAKYEQSFRLFQEARDRWHQAYSLFRLARLHNSTRPREALDLLTRAEQLFRLERDWHFVAASLDEAGTCAVRLTEFAQAERFYRQACEMAHQAGDWREEATSLHNLGFLLQVQGRPWQALVRFREALDIWRKQAGVAARLGEARTMIGIGWVYTSTGDWQRAIDSHWQALRLGNRLRDAQLRSNSLTQIATVWLLTDPRRALPFLKKAWDLQKGTASPADQAATMNGLGFGLRLVGHYEEARTAYAKALELYRSPPDPSGQTITWNNLGWTLLYLNQPGQALESFGHGLQLAREMRNPMAEARSLQGMAESERGRGNITFAQLRAEESLKIVESLRAAVLRPDLQTSYLASNENVYGLLILILMERHRQQPGRGFDLQALGRSEQERARVLLDALSESRELRADLRSQVSPDLLARRRAVLAEFSQHEAQRRRPGVSPADVVTAEQALAESLERLSEINLEIRLGRLGTHPFEPPLSSVDEQRRRLLDRDTILLEYHLGSPHSYLWAVSQGGVQSFELPDAEVLEPLFREAYERLAGIDGVAGDRFHESRLLELSRVLLGPLARQLPGKRLLIAADGTQQYIPFAALPNPIGQHEPLLLQNEIAYVPSLAVLAELRSRQVERKSAPLALAILADPVFDVSDARLSQSGPARPDIGWQDIFLPRLSSSRDEARAIMALLPARQALQALDFDASRDIVISGRLSRYRILHFATHGLQRTDHPELSALVFSRFSSNGEPVDGYLRVPDLAALNLPADLVVLSGCETALGKQMSGEGMVGLPQAFLASGAQRALVSLWQVEDESTAALMAQFYRRLLAGPTSPATALREAQLAIRAQPRWRSPRYWAGFVLQGEWP